MGANVRFAPFFSVYVFQRIYVLREFGLFWGGDIRNIRLTHRLIAMRSIVCGRFEVLECA